MKIFEVVPASVVTTEEGMNRDGLVLGLSLSPGDLYKLVSSPNHKILTWEVLDVGGNGYWGLHLKRMEVEKGFLVTLDVYNTPPPVILKEFWEDVWMNEYL